MQYLPISTSPWLTYRELVKTLDNPTGLIPKGTFDSLKQRGNIRVSNIGGNGREVHIEFDSLPTRPINYQQIVKDHFGDPRKYIAIQPLKDLLHMDDVARKWYADYILPCGKNIPFEYQVKYARSCDWLNMIAVCLKDKRYLKDRMKISITEFWDNVALLIRKDELVHDLPGSVDRLRRIFSRYQDGGYESLVDKHRWGNDFARKVTPKIENLIVSLYCMPHKPYMAEVCKLYREFMAGTLQVVDVHPQGGGEVFDPKEFYITKVKAGKGKPYPYVLGESTVDYYLKQPANEAVVNKLRMKAQDYNSMYRPSVSRLAPAYAFSKITMDDLDIPFKTPDEKRPVKSYQVFDVASGAVVGVSFSRDKNVELIREALRDMFRLIIRKGWGIPWEIEFEKHLTLAMTGGVEEDGTMYDDILTPGAVFPATRICLGGNAKEKRAEGFIRVKKYGQQKKRPGFQARHYAKLLTNRLNTDKDKVRYEYNEIVENELNDIAAHNNELHPKQDLYPGLTRWQVLESTQNPNLAKYQAHHVIQFIGYSTTTSIKAGKTRVQGSDYMLPDMELIKGLTYNGEITAYYLPDEDGMVNSVSLFENGQYICDAQRKVGFQLYNGEYE